MSDDDDRSLANLHGQVRGHLESLRLAGVEWLPDSPEPPSGVTFQPAGLDREGEAPAEPSSASRLGGSLALPHTASAGPGNLDQRRQALQTLANEVKGCTKCAELCSTRTQTVFGDGGPGAELCFIGEAPGADEDAQGLPFVGAAGQLLNRIITACGLKREEVYICNILKCRPPGNRTPLPTEAANCRPFLDRQLELVQPRFICTLGGCAATNLLGTTLSLGKLRGRFHDYKGIPVICTYHPAYLLPHRSPEKKKDVWEDMKTLIAKMGRKLPERQQGQPP